MSTNYSELTFNSSDDLAKLQQRVVELEAKNAEYERAEQLLRALVEGTAAATNADFLKLLVCKLAVALNVRYAFITECIDPKPRTQATRLRTLAFWMGHAIGDNFEYAVTGTPCERVTAEKSCCFYPSNIQSLFPTDQHLFDLHAESYIGIPLLDSEENLMGHLAALDNKPMENRDYLESILRIFTARAAGEMERKQTEEALRESSLDLAKTLHELRRTQLHLVQSEKMSALGQLVAGIAHEINNPVTFIQGNLFPVQQYIWDLLNLLNLYQAHFPQATPEIQREMEAIDLPFLQEDSVRLIESMQVGTTRIEEIVQSLRLFSRLDEAEIKAVNIHDGVDSTLMFLDNRLKSTDNKTAITVLKEYGDLPLVECYAGYLNQVLMNIVVNAIDALDLLQKNSSNDTNPTIKIRTEFSTPDHVTISIADNGFGMDEIVKNQIFNPFFTTKPVGKSTGMGMSISYQIVTEKHGGTLQCKSSPGEGTEFIIEIPIRLSVGERENLQQFNEM